MFGWGEVGENGSYRISESEEVKKMSAITDNSASHIKFIEIINISTQLPK